jgi:acyl-CoA reductase-like NAD-dependent aldehyde dehydrogenase
LSRVGPVVTVRPFKSLDDDLIRQANDTVYGLGGYKQSGWGREMGHAALDNYLETKAICASL